MSIRQIIMVLLTTSCCLLISQDARGASTYGYSDVSFDEGTSKINGYSYTDPDYATEFYYYETFVDAKLSDDAGNVNNPAAVPAYGTTAETRVTMNAWADREYTMEAGHGMYAEYYVNNY